HRNRHDRHGAVGRGTAPAGRGTAGGGDRLGSARRRTAGMSAALIWSAFADEDSAAEAASALLDERLIACANLLPGVRSLYVWGGERGEARECAVLFKTDAALLERACARLAELHPYDTP